MSTLSVIIVTKNEAHNIKDCLETVKWADEIIVVDSLSTDGTVDICRDYTPHVFIKEWTGCGPQKKFALEQATQDWVLCLDADERLSPELQTEIQAILKAPDVHGYELPFQSFYCGKKIRHGDWSNEKHLRLFNRHKGTIIPRLVHFRIEVEGKTRCLQGKVFHYSFPNIESVIRKMNQYSSDGALAKLQSGRRASLFTAIGHGIWAFLRGYFLRLGFLDGREGFMLAISNAEGSYYRYLKLVYLRQDGTEDFRIRDANKPSTSLR